MSDVFKFGGVNQQENIRFSESSPRDVATFQFTPIWEIVSEKAKFTFCLQGCYRERERAKGKTTILAEFHVMLKGLA